MTVLKNSKILLTYNLMKYWEYYGKNIFFVVNELIIEREHYIKGKQEGAIYRYSKTHK